MFFNVSILSAQTLEDHIWENRVVVLFSDDVKNEKVDQQLSEFHNQEESLADRKLVIYTIQGKTTYVFDAKSNMLESSKIKLDNQLINELKDASNFVIVLIGLDGGVKLKSEKVRSRKSIYDKIDGMPMRRSEITKKNKE